MKTILLLSVLLFLSIKSIYTQIVYTNCNDFYIDNYGATPSEFYIDFNGDNIDDFKIRAIYENGRRRSYAFYLNAQQFCYYSKSIAGAGEVKAYNHAESCNNIWSSTEYTNNAFKLCTEYNGNITDCPFLNTPKYFYVKFNLGMNTHYGWIKITTYGTAGATTIHGYAYNSTPNQPIIAGQVDGNPPIGISTAINYTNKISVFPNPSTNGLINIDISNLESSKLSVFDISGKQVFTTQLNQKSSQVDLSILSKGVYYIKFQTQGQQITKKIILN